MTIESWLQACIADAERRGLPELKPMLETLARATTSLRQSTSAQSPVDRSASSVPSQSRQS
jgi:hypothetical protein